MTPKLKHLFAITCLAFVLLGCVGQQTKVLSAIDSSEKTVFVPAGYKGLEGALKNMLEKNGWTVDQFEVIETRYKLVLRTLRTQLLCMSEWTEISYEVFLVDNLSGQEVIYMSGSDCAPYTSSAKAFEKALLSAEQ